ncbi:MAG: acetyltransferase [Caulobacteraceae bacterium]|nr:acetyltransferase [Caulobacteraceae bacterium]
MSPVSRSPRRADLDWIRVGAFGLLIFYHISLVYAPWDWHVNSLHRYDWLRSVALVTNPWRLTLLFLVSGAAVRFMGRRRTPGQVLRARLTRLAPPFLVGVLLLVPPQAFLEWVNKGSYDGGFLAFWLQTFKPSTLAIYGLPINHLWFVLYIGVYSMAAIALLGAPRLLTLLERLCERGLRGWGLLLLPMAYLFLARLLLFAWFGLTNHLLDDWYNHAISLPAFLLGFVAAGSDGFWLRLAAQRRRALVVAIIALPTLIGLETWDTRDNPVWYAGVLRDLAYAVDQGAIIAAILGYGRQYLADKDGPVLRYLTAAVFPCYLIHQTVIVFVAFQLKDMALPGPFEAALLATATVAASLGFYEIVRRLGPLSPLFGLKWERARPEPGESFRPAHS